MSGQAPTPKKTVFTGPLEKLCHWRGVLAGWHDGTMTLQGKGCQAKRDLSERWLIMRAEVSALSELLLEKKIVTLEEFRARVDEEACSLDAMLGELFPGFRTSEFGMEIYDAKLARETMNRLGFPP